MISPKFVKIAREVIKFIKNGGKLRYSELIDNDNKCCPLGAVCTNHNTINVLNLEQCYDYALAYIECDHEFYTAFNYHRSFKNVNLEHSSESYIIGYMMAKLCSRRGWIDQ